jgi:hypothetical protein
MMQASVDAVQPGTIFVTGDPWSKSQQFGDIDDTTSFFYLNRAYPKDTVTVFITGDSPTRYDQFEETTAKFLPNLRFVNDQSPSLHERFSQSEKVVFCAPVTEADPNMLAMLRSASFSEKSVYLQGRASDGYNFVSSAPSVQAVLKAHPKLTAYSSQETMRTLTCEQLREIVRNDDIVMTMMTYTEARLVFPPNATEERTHQSFLPQRLYADGGPGYAANNLRDLLHLKGISTVDDMQVPLNVSGVAANYFLAKSGVAASSNDPDELCAQAVKLKYVQDLLAVPSVKKYITCTENPSAQGVALKDWIPTFEKKLLVGIAVMTEYALEQEWILAAYGDDTLPDKSTNHFNVNPARFDSFAGQQSSPQWDFVTQYLIKHGIPPGTLPAKGQPIEAAIFAQCLEDMKSE